MLPVFRGGRLVMVRRRFWPDTPASSNGKPIKMVGPRNTPAELYPEVPPGRTLIVCEGEFDALLLRQKGLPAVTSTASTSWKPEWDVHTRDRRVAVLYDSGSLDLAERRAAELVAAGAAHAWAVDLGLGHGEDVTDWFITYGRSRAELCELVREAGSAA